MDKYRKLFEPIKIGNCEIKNRFAMAPMGPLGLGGSDGGFNQRGIDYYTERAKGGTGLIITGVTFVDNEIEKHAMANLPCSTLNPIQFIRTAREMTERIHAYNAKVFLQMSGGFGRVAIPEVLGDFPPIAPSEVEHRWLDKTCRELEIHEIKSIVKKFGDGAFNAKKAGFDGVQIHAVHEGYLIDQFAISFFNKRTDEYGGSLENRLRFAREIVEEIKNRCGSDFPVTLRYSPKSFIKDFRDGALPNEEFIEKGRDLEEGIEAARLLVSYGYDALDVDVGSYDSWWWSHPPMYQAKGLYRSFAKLIKEIVDVPILCAGRMDNPDMALKSIENETCDIISLGRPLLADPDYVNKLRGNKVKSIRPCISCQEGCMGRIQHYSMLNCAVNPQACKERANALNPISRKKKVLVVGGGVAGCEAARVLALRGHDVTLYENEILNFNADSVIIATGSIPRVFSLGDDEKVFTAADVLMDKKDCKSNTVIIGGGLVGCETALYLAKKGKKVTIIEALHKLLAVNGPLCSANKEMLEKLIPFNNIDVKLNSKAKFFKDGVLEIENKNGIEKINCDSVILSVGYKEENSLYKELEFEFSDIYLLGDARKVSNIMYAIWDAYEVANHI